VKSLPPALTAKSTRRHHNPKTVIVVAVARRIIVTVGGTTAVTIVVPRAAAQQPEWRPPFSSSHSVLNEKNEYSKSQKKFHGALARAKE
jgi:hypothetical protein